MKMKDSGFSLVELLAAVALLGILTGVAVGAVTGYIDKAKNQAYNSLYKAAYEGCENYVLETGAAQILDNNATGSVSITKLTDDGYITDPIDPNTKTKCTGTVNYKMKKGSGKVADTLVFKVSLSCPGRSSLPAKVFPEGATY